MDHRHGVIICGSEINRVRDAVDSEELRQIADIELRPGLIAAGEMTLISERRIDHRNGVLELIRDIQSVGIWVICKSLGSGPGRSGARKIRAAFGMPPVAP